MQSNYIITCIVIFTVNFEAILFLLFISLYYVIMVNLYQENQTTIHISLAMVQGQPFKHCVIFDALVAFRSTAAKISF